MYLFRQKLFTMISALTSVHSTLQNFCFPEKLLSNNKEIRVRNEFAYISNKENIVLNKLLL